MAYLMSFRHRVVERSEISGNEIALTTELIWQKSEGGRGGACRSRSSADLPKFEPRYDVSRREHEVKSFSSKWWTKGDRHRRPQES